MNSSRRYTAKTLLFYIIAGIIFITFLSVLLAEIWPWGSDFLFYYYPLAEKWLDGNRDIYNPNVSALFYPPWSLFVIVPLGLLPIRLAHGFQLSLSFVAIIISIRLLKDSKTFPKYFYILSLINLHSLDLYIRGQLDAIVLFGIALGYWAIQNRKPVWLSLGFCLMVMKPPLNVILVLVLFLIAIRYWSKKELFITFLAPVVMVIISSLAIGIDWPIKYIKNMTPTIDYLSISIWKITDMIGLSRWIVGIVACLAVYRFLREAMQHNLSFYTLSLALSTTFCFTVYANGDHYVLLIPAFLYVLGESFPLGIMAFLVTLTPLLRLLWGSNLSSIDLIYPILLLSSTYYLMKKEESVNLNDVSELSQNNAMNTDIF